MSCLRFEMHGAVALVTFDRPPANALNHAFMSELVELLPRLQAPEVRAAVLTGHGRMFSAGLDLFEVFGYSTEQGLAFSGDFDDAITGLFALELPMVAAINGHAIAGGAVLAATTDFRLCTQTDAKIGLPELLVGVPFPTSALEAVRYSCDGPHLQEVLLRGKTYAPTEALTRRLVDELVPAGELLPRALALATELAAPPRTAYALTKRGLRAPAVARMQAARKSGQDPVWAMWRSPETLAAMAAYRGRIGASSR